MDSTGTSTPIEPVALDVSGDGRGRGPSFAAGVAVGIVLAAIAAQLWLAQHLEPLRGIERDFAATLGSLSKLAVSPLWRWGVPAAFAATLAGLAALRARATWIYAVVAALAVALLVLTYVWATAPLHELADNIAVD